MAFSGQIFFTNNKIKVVPNGLLLYLDAGKSDSAPPPGTGTRWTDLSRNGNNGTLVSGASYSAGFGGSVNFNGNDGFVNCGTSTAFQFTKAAGYTLSAWVLTPVAGTFNNQIVMFRGVTTPFSYWGYSVNLVASGFNGITNGVVLTTNGNNTFGGISNIISTNTWTHVTVTVAGNVNNNAKIFTNGVNRGSPLNNGAVVNFQDGATNADLGVTQEFYLGRKVSFYDWFTQRQAIVAVYNRALSESEVQQNFNADRARFGV